MTAAPLADPAQLVELLRACADGDQVAFAKLYQRTSGKLFGVCLRMLRERGEAEDALQDLYINVWRRAASFDSSLATAMTWLITLARNQCIDRLRRHREEPLDDTAAQRIIDPGLGPPASSEAGEERRRLEHCLDMLADQQRQAVRAAFFTGATYNQLANCLGVPLATMKSWIRRSLIRLRACLEQTEANP
ncbi:MAG: sigma-70 family RNA polymerase sigma factor [Rhodanobacteraceae bacterium]|nr:MAG: sigma-70 family RNA polymerase sigma factor [Rhodanobacteraceae bacterium]